MYQSHCTIQTTSGCMEISPSVKLCVVVRIAAKSVKTVQQHVNYPRGTVKLGGRRQKLVSASHHRILWFRVILVLTPWQWN